MRKSVKAIGALLTAVMIMTMLSSVALAAPTILSNGSNSDYSWTLYSDYKLEVSANSYRIDLSYISAYDLSRVESVVINFSKVKNSYSGLQIKGNNCSAKSFEISDFYDLETTQGIIDILDFPSIESNKITFPEGAKISRVSLDNVGMTAVTLSSGVEIKELSIKNCQNVKSISLNDKITSLTIYSCPEVNEVKNTGSLKTIALRDLPKLKSVNLPDTYTYLSVQDCAITEVKVPNGARVRLNGDNSIKAVLSDGIVKTSSDMFAGSRALTDVVIPKSVTVIQYQTFFGCQNLKSVNLPENVKTIGQSAFADSGLESVKLPSGCLYIRANAFGMCESLDSVIIPKSVQQITCDAFCYCNISDVYYSGTEEQWNKITILGSDFSSHSGNLTIAEVFGNAKIHFNYVSETGWIQNGSDWYYYDTNGNMVTGWKSIDGMWFYFDNTGVMLTGWVKDGGKWYYLDPTLGAMVTGWKLINGKYYCFDNSGVMKTGWVGSGSTWYYLDGSGAMTTGWLDYKSKWYYFNDNGVMVTGWKGVGGKWYYFDGSGAMVTGWKQIGNDWYYFKSSGAMASNEYCEGYFLNPDGKWTYKFKATWHKNGTGWWFGDDNGWYAKNRSLTINDKVYIFDASGYCTNP